MDKINLTKWFALGLGGVIGISHIGMIGMLARRDSSKLPSLNMPVGEYTSYEAHVNEDGYSVSYRANDPKTMVTTIDRKAKGGFLGLANNTTKEVIEFTADGAAHHGGPVSTKTAWIDPAALAIQAAANPKETSQQKQSLASKQEVVENRLVVSLVVALVLLLLLPLVVYLLLVG